MTSTWSSEDSIQIRFIAAVNRSHSFDCFKYDFGGLELRKQCRDLCNLLLSFLREVIINIRLHIVLIRIVHVVRAENHYLRLLLFLRRIFDRRSSGYV